MKLIIDISKDRYDEIMEMDWRNCRRFFDEEIRAIHDGMPQRAGHWIAQDIHNCHTDFKCSECGYIHSFMHLYGKPTANYTYCPNCGANMEE